MIKRLPALLASLALFGTLCMASANAATENVKVINMTQTPAWITLYADVGAFGWAQHHFAKPEYSRYGAPWVYARGSKDPNGPWKVRFELTKNGRKYDLFTTFWYDGAQHRDNVSGDPNSYLYVCEDGGGFYWSHLKNCNDHANTPGI